MTSSHTNDQRAQEPLPVFFATAPRSWRPQERLEASAAGQAIISVVLLLAMVAVLTANLPESKLRRELIDVTQGYTNALTIDQNWGVFAPDPRRESIYLEARINFKDGYKGTWRPPLGGRLIGGYHDYRWRKWFENVLQPNREDLYPATAEYIAREESTPKRRPVQVILVRRSKLIPAPGSDGPRPREQRADFFVHAITEQMLR